MRNCCRVNTASRREAHENTASAAISRSRSPPPFPEECGYQAVPHGILPTFQIGHRRSQSDGLVHSVLPCLRPMCSELSYKSARKRPCLPRINKPARGITKNGDSGSCDQRQSHHVSSFQGSDVLPRERWARATTSRLVQESEVDHVRLVSLKTHFESLGSLHDEIPTSHLVIVEGLAAIYPVR